MALGDRRVKTFENKIPLLDDVFKAFPNTPMNIELKTFSEEAAQ
jgi:glycerophosphoryl diester phosphodiesterase